MFRSFVLCALAFARLFLYSPPFCQLLPSHVHRSLRAPVVPIGRTYRINISRGRTCVCSCSSLTCLSLIFHLHVVDRSVGWLEVSPTRRLRTALLPLTTCEHRCCTVALSLSISCVVWSCLCMYCLAPVSQVVRACGCGCALCIVYAPAPPSRAYRLHAPTRVYTPLSLSLALSSRSLSKQTLGDLLFCFHVRMPSSLVLLVVHRLWIRVIVAVTDGDALSLLSASAAAVVVVIRHPSFVYSHRYVCTSLKIITEGLDISHVNRFSFFVCCSVDGVYDDDRGVGCVCLGNAVGVTCRPSVSNHTQTP